MTQPVADIESKQDIEKIVNSFYEKVKADSLLGAAFAHVDWPKHLPVMYTFWHSIIFETYEYKGNPFAKHQALPLQPQHFDRWLALFTKTVDDHFAGVRATRMKEQANQIALIFQHRMNLIPKDTL